MNAPISEILGKVSILLLLYSGLSATRLAVARPLIFPEPREVEARSDRFSLEQSVPVLLPKEASGDDLLLARFLVAELSDRHGVALETKRTSTVPAGGRFILMGSVGNPWSGSTYSAAVWGLR